jgi:hypothetical protein
VLRPYNDPDYRRAAAWLKANPDTPCTLRLPGCTGLATTIDHQPAITEHAHVRGAQCCTLRPACHHCNSSHGATLGNRRRNPTSRDWYANPLVEGHFL